jgi:hypothetical protein
MKWLRGMLAAWTLAGLGTLAGCETAREVRSPGRFLVPSTALRGSDVPAEYLLPTNSLAEAVYPRGERTAYGPPMAEGSAYTIYTVDQEPIGNPDGYGYRYRYTVRQGYTLP